jgi:hypothetical protein
LSFSTVSLASFPLYQQDETTPEEALTWIPSLSRFDDEEIMKAVSIVVEAKEKLSEGL